MNVLATLLVIGGVLHLGTLSAGALVPRVLDFRGQLKNVSGLLRQLVWVYAVFIFLTVVAFGAVSVTFAETLAGGTPLARAICGFIAVFWTARLVIQFFVFDAKPYLRNWFLKAGYHVLLSNSGEAALAAAKSELPALILLDIMLPGLDGLEICRRLKREPDLRKIRIVMVTAKGEEDHIVAGLEAGADDYIVKPFSPRVLVARVEAVLRRGAEPEKQGEDVIHSHSIEIHPGKREVRVDGDPIALTFSEFSMLRFLASRPGWVFTRAQIISALHGDDHHVSEKTVDVHVRGLRKKLGTAGELIESIRGVGYRFRE